MLYAQQNGSTFTYTLILFLPLTNTKADMGSVLPHAELIPVLHVLIPTRWRQYYVDALPLLDSMQELRCNLCTSIWQSSKAKAYIPDHSARIKMVFKVFTHSLRE